jgi:RHS repeat-associated protein
VVLRDVTTGTGITGTQPSANEAQVFDYTYAGGAGWRFDNDPSTALDRQSWSEWRGYSTLTTTRKKVTGGSITGDRSRTVAVYFRGMDGDKLSGGGTRSVSVSTADGGAQTDHVFLAGRIAETYEQSETGAEWSRTWTGYTAWHTGSAGAAPSGFVNRGGYLVAPNDVKARTTVGGVAAAVKTRTVTDYVSVAPADRGEIWTGVVAAVRDLGDESTTADDRCTGYANHWRTDAWLRAVTQTTSWSGACGSGTQVGRTDTFYDTMTAVTGNVEDAGLSRLDPVKTLTYPSASTAITARASFDSYGRLVDAVDGNGRLSRTSYSPATGIPTTVSVRGPKPDGTTNQDGSPAGFTTTSTLDAGSGLPTAVTDANGGVTSLAYDGLGRLTRVRKPGQQASGHDTAAYAYYVPRSSPTRVTTTTLQSDGSTPVYATLVAYADGWGRPIQTQTPAPTGGGRVLTVTRYDDRGNVYGQSGPVSATGTPGSGWVAVDPATLPAETVNWYDAADRNTVTLQMRNGTEAWRTVRSFNGSASAGPSVYTDPPTGGNVLNKLDARGRVTTINEYRADGTGYAATQLGYDHADRLTTVTSPQGRQSTYGYDWLGRRTTITDPDTGASSSTYDNNGNTLTSTDARGVTVATDYDALNRPTRRYTGTAANPSVLATWVYDTLANGKGSLASATAKITPPGQTGPADYTQAVAGYTADGQPTGATTTIPTGYGAPATSYTESYGYDAAGHVTTAVLPAVGGLPAETVTAAWTALGLPSTLTSTSGGTTTSLVNSTSFDALGRLTGRRWASASGPSRGYGYDQLNRLTSTVTNIGGTGWQNDTYTYTGPDLTRTTDTLAGQRQCYTYDDLRRLNHAWTTNTDCTDPANPNRTYGPSPYDQTWTYDTDNTLTTTTDAAPGTTTTFTTGSATGEPAHAPTTITRTGTGPGTTTLHYDASGYLLTRTPTSGTATTLTWDALHRLTSSTDEAGTTRFAYGPDGDRLIRATPTETTLTLGTTDLVYPADGSTPLARRHYTLAGATVAVRTTTTTGTTTLAWLAADPQASTDTAIDAATGAFTRTRYTPYGTPRTTTPGPHGTGLPTDHGWLGKTLDQTTGLNHLGARYYDTTLDQFTAPDPLLDPTNPRTINPYTYSWGNPIALSDPSGLYATFDPVHGGYTCFDACSSPSPWETGYNPDAPHTPSYGGSPRWNAPPVHPGGAIRGGSSTPLSGPRAFVPPVVAPPVPEAPAGGGAAGGVLKALGWIGGVLLLAGGESPEQRVEETAEAEASLEDEPVNQPDNKNDRNPTYITYLLINKTTGQVYSGRATGYGPPEVILRARLSSHHKIAEGYEPLGNGLEKYAKGTRRFEKRRKDPAYQAIRGREQQLIDNNGGAKSDGGNSGNAIRGVAKYNEQGRTFWSRSNLFFGFLYKYTGY